MTGPQTRTPLQQVLDGQAETPGLLPVEVTVWSYREQFDKMWIDLDSKTIHGEHVIVWSGTPDGDGGQVDTAPFLSPLDWAVCAAKQCADAKTPLCVRVLDLNPTDHRTRVPLYTLVAALNAGRAPWLQVLQAADLLDDGRGHKVVDRLGLSSTVAPAGDTLNLLLDYMRMGLSDPKNPDNRHSIANLIGPLLLLGKPPEQLPENESVPRAKHVMALRSLLAATGLVPKSPAEVSTGSSARSAPVVLAKGTRVFLLDDQWQQGWGQWVCEQVGATFTPPTAPSNCWAPISKVGDTVEVFATGDPQHLLTALTAGQKDKRFGLSLAADVGSSRDILLLDLRLFAGDHQAERAWTQKVVDACPSFVGGEHAWPAFDGDRLKQVDQWCKAPTAGNGADPTATEARGLLGRLAALTDLSFPIVLFSSTADSDLIEQFKDYGNIITSFHKPRTFGASVIDGPEEYRRLFGTALQEAILLLDARAFIKQVKRWAKDGRALANQLAKEGQGDSGSAPWRYAEIYLDETGKKPDTVGGYVVLYRNAETEPSQLAASLPKSWGFDREGSYQRTTKKRAGQQPFDEPTTGTYQKIRDFAKGLPDLLKAELIDRAKTVARAARTAKLGLAGCLISIGPEGQSAPAGPDSTYRFLSAATVEFFLHDWLPALELAWNLPHDTLKAGVFLASRAYHPTHGTGLFEQHWRFGLPLEFGHDPDSPNAIIIPADEVKASRDLEQIDGLLGYMEESSDRFYVPPPTGEVATVNLAGRSIGWQDAYAIVVSIARLRGVQRTVRSAVGVGMREYGGRGHKSLPWPSQLPRRIHYASDDFIFTPYDGRPIYQAEARGFRGILSDKLDLLFNASRALDVPNTLPQALQCLREAGDSDDTRALLPWICVRAEPLLDKMSGTQFIQFSTRAGFDGSAVRSASRHAAVRQLTATKRRITSKRPDPRSNSHSRGTASVKPYGINQAVPKQSVPSVGGEAALAGPPANQREAVATDTETRISEIVDLATGVGLSSVQAPQMARLVNAPPPKRRVTAASLEATVRECLESVGVNTVEIVKVAVSDSFNIVAVRSTDQAVDGAGVCRGNQLAERVNKALGIPLPRFVNWTDDPVTLVKYALGNAALGATVVFEEGAIEIVPRIGTSIVPMRIQVLEDLVGCRVHVRAIS